MVKILPIRGITYNLSQVDINGVVAPPYDVISKDEQEELYNASPYNIVRLILGKTFPVDDNTNNRYLRSARDFKEWMGNNILIKAAKPCLYYYIQNYTSSNGKFISRKGFIAGAFLEEFSQGNILPHEYTMGGPKEDRLKLMKECKANFSQIFMVYSDPEHKINNAFELPETPFIDVADKNGVRNLVYVIQDEEIVDKVCRLMEDKKVLIADGHHRYETGLAYRDYMRSINPDYNDSDEFNHIMCYFTSLDDEGLQVYPTHRIITKQVDAEKLLKNLKEYFNTEIVTFDESNKQTVREQFIQKLETLSQEKIVMGMYFKNNNNYILLELKNSEPLNKILAEKEVPEILRGLDLTILHKIIVEEFLEISENDQINQNGIKYIKKEEEAFKAVESNSAELVFLMASPKIKDIKEISQAGYRMPQKSTYFYPKLLSGLVINPLE